MVIDEVVKRIVERRAEVPEKLSLLVGISCIDGCGKATSPRKSKRAWRNTRLPRR